MAIFLINIITIVFTTCKVFIFTRHSRTCCTYKNTVRTAAADKSKSSLNWTFWTVTNTVRPRINISGDKHHNTFTKLSQLVAWVLPELAEVAFVCENHQCIFPMSVPWTRRNFHQSDYSSHRTRLWKSLCRIIFCLLLKSPEVFMILLL